MKEKDYFFDHEKLDVYQASIAFVILTEDILENLPRGRAYLVDQLQRASSSILLNIAEGAGEFSTNEKIRFYRMARRSATECAGIIAIIQCLNLIKVDAQKKGRELLLRIVSMLSKMIKLNGSNSGNASANANVHEVPRTPFVSTSVCAKFGLTEKDIYLIQNVIKRYPDVTEALIFGSRAMGNYRPGSDVDIALKGELKSSTCMDISVELNERLPLPYRFDVVNYSSITNELLIDHIDEFGKNLFF